MDPQAISDSNLNDPHNSDREEPLGAGIDFTDPNSPLAPYYLQNGDVLGVLLLGFAIVTLSYLPLWHTDIWGHVLFGEWMIEHGTLPAQEPFCLYSDKNVAPVHAQWLTQIAYGAMIQLSDRIGRGHADPQRSFERGVEFIRAIHLFFLAVQFIFLWLACRRISGSSAWANVTLIVLFLVLFFFSSIQRPQSLGLGCFAVLLYVLSRTFFSRAAVFGLPILFALWANLHGSVVLGLAFFFLTLLGTIVQNRWQTDKTDWGEVFREASIRRMLAAFFLSLAAACINPHGPFLYVHVLNFANAHPIIPFLDEWRPLEFNSGRGSHLMFLGLWAFLLLAWILSGFANSVRLLTILPFGFWPLFQVRGMIWWCMLVPWVFASFGPAITQRIGLLKRFPKSVPSFRKTLLAGSIVLLVLLWLRPVKELLSGRLEPLDRTLSASTPWRLGFELQATPETQGRWLPAFADAVRSYPNGRYRGTIFCSETFSDYLLRYAPPDAPIVLYSHAHYFDRDYYLSCMDVKYAEGDWRNWLVRHQVNMVVIDPQAHSKLAVALRDDPAWQIVVDEINDPGARQDFNRLFIAVRKKPL